MNREQLAQQYVDSKFEISLANQKMSEAFLAGFDAGVKHAEEWISVETKPPTPGRGQLLAIIETTHKPEKESFLMVVNYDGDWILPLPMHTVKVTHWKLLPPKPTEK